MNQPTISTPAPIIHTQRGDLLHSSRVSNKFVSRKDSLLLAMAVGMALGLLMILASSGRAWAAGTLETPDSLAQQTLVITFQPGAGEAERSMVIAGTGGQVVRWIPALDSAVIRLPVPTDIGAGAAVRPEQRLAEVLAEPSVHTAAIDGVANATFTPNDPDFTNPNLVYAPQIIHAPAAWDLTLGDANVVIAVLDTGIQSNHEEFQGRLMAGYDFQNDDADPTDDRGHGTHVAGIASARTDNGLGMAGICGNCTLLPVKVLDHSGSGLWSTVAAGIVYATDQGADIINLSLGGYNSNPLLQSAVEYAQAHGVLIVAAVGNHASSDLFFPAAYAGVLGVAATTPQDELWTLNNQGDYVDVVAPGERIYSAYGSGTGSAYTLMSGTSMAAPHVSGLAGLLLSLNPDLSSQDLHHIITAGTVEINGADATPNSGHGRIDAMAAISHLNMHAASITGRIWHDANANGIQDADEMAGMADLAVRLLDVESGDVYETTSDDAGLWQFTALGDGAYMVQLTEMDGLFTTTPAQLQIVLGAGEMTYQVGFGLSHSLPSDAVSDFAVDRHGEQINVRWRVSHPQVETMIVQRASSAQGPFETVAILDAGQAFNAEGINLVDNLPTDMQESPIFYRLQVDPSQLIVGPLAALDMTTSGQIFLPQVTNR